MAIPGFSKAVAKGAIKSLPGGNLISAAVEAATGKGGGAKTHRRRRYRPLTKSLIADLSTIKNSLGTKAAESYLLKQR